MQPEKELGPIRIRVGWGNPHDEGGSMTGPRRFE